MVKPFKTLDEQIAHLEKNKNVVINNKDEAKSFLLNNNYYNVISTAKIRLLKQFDVATKKHIYDSADFSVWKEYYEKDCLLSEILLNNIINVDKQINSRLAYYLSEIVQNKKILSEQEKNKIKRMLNESKQNIADEYNFEYTWVYVTSLTLRSTFKIIKQIKKWISYREKQIDSNRQQIQYLKDCYSDILRSYNTIQDYNELVNLRNHLAHYVPLAVYLTGKGVFKNRLQVVNIVLNVSSSEIANEEIQTLSQDAQIFLQKKRASNSTRSIQQAG